jgi:MerR family transcriptional regulator, copper efflux regulator
MAKVHRLPLVGAPSSPEIPEDDGELLQVGELARAVGKTVRAIHHYEEIGLLKPHKRSKGRYRLYAPDAVARVRWLDKLHALGMSLTEIQHIVATWEQAPSAPGAMAKIRDVYQTKLEEVHQQIARLGALEHELRASLAYLDTCEICDPGELVAACSACTVHDKHQHEPELVSGLYACTHGVRMN